MALVPDYGRAVPKVPLAFATTAALVGVAAAWSGLVGLGVVAAGAAGLFGASGASTLYSDRLGRSRVWDEILAAHPLRGDERVLDVGCGRGALLVALARRLGRGGKVVGIHPWTAGQSEAPTRQNVVAEGMAARVTLQPGDLRSLPFLDRTFPLIVSSLAIHTLPDAPGREQAVSEMWRVLADGGTLLLVDRLYGADYARVLRNLGAEPSLRSLGWRLWSGGPHRAASLVVARRS